jgi:PEP-CTERM motif
MRGGKIAKENQMRKMIVALAMAATAAVSMPANAGLVRDESQNGGQLVFTGSSVFTGDTTGGLVYNRPIANGNLPPVTLSGVGTAVRYVVTPFTVTISGNYNFFNTTNYDSYLGLHVGSFDPTQPLLNAVAYSDDFNGTLDGGFSNLALVSGVSYFAISSGFDNTDFGAFRLDINGPGNILPIGGGGGGGGGGVPEPATWAMMLFGFAGIGSALRRRRSTAVAVTA